MLLAIILVVFLIGNWAISETLVFVPVNLVSRLTFLGWWGLAVVLISFLAWCIGDD